jgi:hypothetical protein
MRDNSRGLPDFPGVPRMMRLACLLLASLAGPVLAQFKLAPAVVAEAEDFSITDGWKAVRNGQGNSMVDIIGFNHLSGERVLHLPATASKGSATLEIHVPVAGDYRLWVRYEYATGTDCRFRVRVNQGDAVKADAVLGKRDSLRYSYGAAGPAAQTDMPYGPEGLHEEVVVVKGLAAGKATLALEAVAPVEEGGVAAPRNVDVLYLSSDTRDEWRREYGKRVNLYPILEAIRETLGPRWEVRVTNHGTKPTTPRVRHVYNRIPWGMSEPARFEAVAPGAASEWIGLRGQDTSHMSMLEVDAPGSEISVEFRAVGTKKSAVSFRDSTVRVYLPPYPGKGEDPVNVLDALDRVLAELKASPAPGKKPTVPLCYGGWMPLGREDTYGRKYAQLYAALGFRSLHPAHSGPKVIENLDAVGIPLTKSWAVSGYRNPPTDAAITRAKADLARRKLTEQVRFFDYGDEIGFSEWVGMMLSEEVAAAKQAGQPVTAEAIVRGRWIDWLKRNRPKLQIKDYWLPVWGPFVASQLRPDSSASTARTNPRLFIDSLLFYEELAIGFAARGKVGVKAALGTDVLCGANYSCHPFYYPSATMYIKWFREGAADMGRHSEYFWQVGQAGPMINGYIAEHFRSGMRDTPGAVLRQYTMPHAPGNTDANFVRSAFTHLAHGATMLDFFGIGMNETFTENHIDFRAISRYKAIRDVVHAVGFVEDVLSQAKAVPSKVAMLISESTERWDMAPITSDRAGHNPYAADFPKVRTHFHLDRLGLWKALTFAGQSPDLVTEEDIIDGKLGEARVLIAVGDCWSAEMIPALERWVKAGGTVLATAGAGSRDEYGQATAAFHQLAGLAKVETRTESAFLRPRMELPRLKPLATIQGEGWTFPVLATQSRLTPADGTKVLAKGAMTERAVGKGKVVYLAAHPGLAYLHAALQPPVAPDRGPVTHTVPTSWDENVLKMLMPLFDEPLLKITPALVDARLLKTPKGYLLPLASYTGKQGEAITLELGISAKTARSAFLGDLKIETVGQGIRITLPRVTYGDIVRLE